MVQSAREIEEWYGTQDPWGYESHSDDALRKTILLAELPQRHYAQVLDIGCGQGFVTRDLPGERVLGVDISAEAIARARTLQDARIEFRRESLFELAPPPAAGFDLVVITGVLYPQYIGRAHALVYRIIDRQLAEGGVLACVHIDQWYQARFPYLMIREHFYRYREFTHRLEVYVK